jgi:hypothetical protein
MVPRDFSALVDYSLAMILRKLSMLKHKPVKSSVAIFVMSLGSIISAQTKQAADAQILELYRLTDMPVPFSELSYSSQPSSVPGKTVHNYLYFKDGITVQGSVMGDHLKHILVRFSGGANRPSKNLELQKSAAASSIRQILGKVRMSRPRTLTVNWIGSQLTTDAKVDGFDVNDAHWAKATMSPSGKLASISMGCAPTRFKSYPRDILLADSKRKIPARELSSSSSFRLVWKKIPKQIELCMLVLEYRYRSSSAPAQTEIVQREAATGKEVKRIAIGRVR